MPDPARPAEYVVVFGPSEHCPNCLGRGYWYGTMTTVRIPCRRCKGLGYVQLEEGAERD